MSFGEKFADSQLVDWSTKEICIFAFVFYFNHNKFRICNLRTDSPKKLAEVCDSRMSPKNFCGFEICRLLKSYYFTDKKSYKKKWNWRSIFLLAVLGLHGHEFGPGFSPFTTEILHQVCLAIYAVNTCELQCIISVLRFRDVSLGSHILIFTHPGSRIQKQQQKRGMKKNLLSYLFL